MKWVDTRTHAERLSAIGKRMANSMANWSGAADVTPGLQFDTVRVDAFNRRNRQQTLILSASMAVLLVSAAALLAGGWGIILIVASLTSTVLLGPRIAPETVMTAYGAEPVRPPNGRAFLDLVAELAKRAELPRPPDLYVISSSTLNAFAVGTRGQSALALTEGLIRKLQMRELAGVMAHEISHIRNGDLWIMGLADGITRMARILSLSALALMAMNLISVMTGVTGMSWLGLLLLYLAPVVSSLLQQALSRTRELDADIDGVTLTGDAEGLASALAKLEAYQGRPWEDLVYGMRQVPQPSLLRSHPTTAERISHLKAISKQSAWPQLHVADGPLMTGRVGAGTSSMRPRYRWKTGTWY